MVQGKLYMENEVEIKIVVFAPSDDNAGDGVLSKADAETELAALFNDEWGIRATTATEDYVVMVLQRAKKESVNKKMGFLASKVEE